MKFSLVQQGEIGRIRVTTRPREGLTWSQEKRLLLRLFGHLGPGHLALTSLFPGTDLCQDLGCDGNRRNLRPYPRNAVPQSPPTSTHDNVVSESFRTAIACRTSPQRFTPACTFQPEHSQALVSEDCYIGTLVVRLQRRLEAGRDSA